MNAHRLWSIGVGAAATALGLVLLAHPFSTLEILVWLLAGCLALIGIADIATPPAAARAAEARRWGYVRGGLLLVAALVLLVAMGSAITTLAVVVGIALVADGALRGWWVLALGHGLRARITESCFAVSSAVLGILALSWPDITLVVLAMLVGIRVAWWGVSLIWDAVRGERNEAEAARPRLFTALLSLALVLGLAGLSSVLSDDKPEVDAFYTPPATEAGEDEPEAGTLLRAEPFTRGLPAGARGWRILYTTTRSDGVPATSSGLVVVSATERDEPRPVVAWAHGTTGVARRCAPSLAAEPLAAGAMPAAADVVERGWAIVATDYIGLGTPGPHPYLIGDPSARAVLDAVRAARRLDGLRLAQKAVVWGHSQGGGAALWTGQTAPTYAPDVELAGVAALAPASDLTRLVTALDDTSIGGIFAAYAISAYAAVYDDVAFARYVRPAARRTMRSLASRCLAERAAIASVVTALGTSAQSYQRRSPTTGALGRRLRENTPDAPIPAPVFLAQGLADVLVTPAAQDAYVAARCTAGGSGPLRYQRYPAQDHISVIGSASPMVADLLAWTEARFAGAPAGTTCPS
ncbi:lipase family protein [Nocardioides sp. Bht2]|uniref:lipase family protein n=1 Tax=Nocardioides sp. Bht2 TaxID=3392297 RepID=UPI0039B61727